MYVICIVLCTFALMSFWDLGVFDHNNKHFLKELLFYIDLHVLWKLFSEYVKLGTNRLAFTRKREVLSCVDVHKPRVLSPVSSTSGKCHVPSM